MAKNMNNTNKNKAASNANNMNNTNKLLLHPTAKIQQTHLTEMHGQK